MVNRSKVNDPRFWNLWRNSGAVEGMRSAYNRLNPLLTDSDYLTEKYDPNLPVQFAETGKIAEVWTKDQYPTGSYRGQALVLHLHFDGGDSIFSYRDHNTVQELVKDAGRKNPKDLEGLPVICIRQLGSARGIRI